MTTSSPAAVSPKEDARLRTYLETKGLKFVLRTGQSKWECTVRDRASHEKEKAARESSSSSVTTTDSSTSSTASL